MTSIDIYIILRESLRRKAKLFKYHRFIPRANVMPKKQVHVEIKEGATQEEIEENVRQLCQNLLDAQHTSDQFLQCYAMIVPAGLHYVTIIQARPLIVRFIQNYDTLSNSLLGRLDVLFRWERL